MKPEIFLRIASVLMLVHLIGHSFGTLSWKKTNDPVKQEVIRQMTDHQFSFMGANRSMGDIVDGYGFATFLSLFLIMAILWVSSNNTTAYPGLIRSFLILLSVLLFLWGIIELVYFFSLAAVLTLVTMVLTVIAIFQLNKKFT